jgi:hypothetical protein
MDAMNSMNSNAGALGINDATEKTPFGTKTADEAGG